MIDYILRSMTPSDEAFIMNSFLQSLRSHSMFSYTAKSIYYKAQADIITRLLSRATTLVAVFPEDPDQIIGYIIYEYFAQTLIVHWIYVKTMFRHHRISLEIIKPLLRNRTIVATYAVHYFGALKSKIKDTATLIYDPFIMNTI